MTSGGGGMECSGLEPSRAVSHERPGPICEHRMSLVHQDKGYISPLLCGAAGGLGKVRPRRKSVCSCGETVVKT